MKITTSTTVPFGVCAVDDVNQDVGVFEVIPPVRSNLPLTSDVPNVQLESVGIDAFDVETWG